MQNRPRRNSPFWRTLGKTKEQAYDSLKEIPKFVLDEQVGTAGKSIQEES
jgi:hypothetical protein